MYVLYKSKNILTLLTIRYIVGFIVSMYIEYCLWAQVAVLNHKLLYWTVWDRFIQVLYLGRAPRTKETLLDFREKCRVTRHSRVFRGLTGSQRTPGFRASQRMAWSLGVSRDTNFVSWLVATFCVAIRHSKAAIQRISTLRHGAERARQELYCDTNFVSRQGGYDTASLDTATG